ncbi:hypothetical protein EJB05_33400 [Eragrostis curvula]|uniref:Protein kinase domain-containing protein n=1 Tax=Eragrostis curvula TaxID=38414 RepID=A0A5J9U101_9POAL|nr:hypothetical protein EJB05_33400 [Eragrostis curvula]
MTELLAVATSSMGNCFGLEEAEVEAVKNFGHYGQPQAAAAARALPMAAPKPADASVSSGHRSSRSPSPSTNSSTCATSGGDAGAYLEGRILETPNLRIFTFGELRAATRNFKPDTVLGEGGFGRVYKGWVDGLLPAASRHGDARPPFAGEPR